MIVDLNESEVEPPEYDVCIVGSGPAGATVAAELASSPLRVCVLESGRLRTTRHADELKRVLSEGIHVKDYSRERVLGGASTTWAGLSSPLDAADLAPRSWLRVSGWPIGLDELRDYYAQAAERYRFPEPGLFGVEGFGALRAQGALQPEWRGIEEKIFLACSEPQDFGRETRSIYEDGPVDLYLDASVSRLETGPACGRIAAAIVHSRNGREHRLHARTFVIAAGGIENARLLLNSRGACPEGLGNEHDLVGRFLMNHPKNYHGILHLARPIEEAPYFFGCLHRGYAGYAGLRLPQEVQTERRLMNSYVRLEPLFPWSDSRGVESLVLLVKRCSGFLRSWKDRRQDELVTLRDYSETGDDSDLQNARKSLLEWIGVGFSIVLDAPRVVRYLWFRLTPARPRIRRVRLRNFMEMEPDPENRVALGAERDVYGEPIPFVRHDSTALDRRSLVELHAALRQEISRTGLGRLETELADADPWPITQDASHHMGTTRMGTESATSVVDPHGRIHSVENVYLAGASVFPTSGCANPTFTIVALSIRLAQHLREVVFAEQAAR